MAQNFLTTPISVFRRIFIGISAEDYTEFVKILLKFHAMYPLANEECTKIKPFGRPRSQPGHVYHLMPLVFGDISRLSFFFPFLPNKVSLILSLFSLSLLGSQ